MNVVFWLLALLMLVLALALVLPPLLRRPASQVDHNRANIAIHRQRLAELDAEVAAGTLAPDTAAEARSEIERQLLSELQPEQRTQSRPSRVVAASVAVLLPLLAVGLYFQLGGQPPENRQAQVPADREGQIAFIREHLKELEMQVEAQPENLDGWLMLARSHMVLQQYEQAAQTLARAQERFGQEPNVLADRAEAAGYAAGGDLSGLPAELLQAALRVEPAHPKALWLAGLAAMQRDDSGQAEQYWRRLLAVLPPDSGPAQQVEQMLAQFGAQPAAEPEAAGQSALQVEVRLDPALAGSLPAEGTVFVLARAAEGPRAPLAVVRHAVGDLPLNVRLDDSMAMVEGMNLSRFPAVVVEARISRSGQAITQSGDLVGRSEPIQVGGSKNVEVVIDQIAP